MYLTNLEKRNSCNVGSIRFNLRPKREVGCRVDPLRRLVYDSDKIATGLQILKSLPAKGNVEFDKHTIRDNKMFHFDKEDVKEVERQVHPAMKLKFSDPIPTNLTKSSLDPE